MQLLGTGKQRAMKTARVQVGGSYLTLASWKITVTAEDFPTVNFESYNITDNETYDEGIHGALKASGSYGGDWDAGTNPFGVPPGLYIRDDLATVNMFMSRLDATQFTFPYQRLRSTDVGGDVGGKVTFNVGQFMNQGRFTYSTGSV